MDNIASVDVFEGTSKAVYCNIILNIKPFYNECNEKQLFYRLFHCFTIRFSTDFVNAGNASPVSAVILLCTITF